MQTIFITCTYKLAASPQGSQSLLDTNFMVELSLDHYGTVVSWKVDDLTACYYTKLANYDENEIIFEGSEIDGQTGTLHINLTTNRFIQISDVKGEWLVLAGDCELVSA